jgi:hypothetical protein
LHEKYNILAAKQDRNRFHRKYLKLKTALSQTIFKQQRNRVNNLKKQLKEKCYTNINENLNELKTINSKTYWKTINTLLKGESTMNDIPPIQDPKTNYCLHLIVTSRLGIHSSDTERITLVKLIHALSISGSLLIKAS